MLDSTPVAVSTFYPSHARAVALRANYHVVQPPRKTAATNVPADLAERVTFLKAMPDANPALETERERAAAAVERWLLTALQTVMSVASLASASGEIDIECGQYRVTGTDSEIGIFGLPALPSRAKICRRICKVRSPASRIGRSRWLEAAAVGQRKVMKYSPGPSPSKIHTTSVANLSPTYQMRVLPRHRDAARPDAIGAAIGV